MKRLFITGETGFVGRTLQRVLAQQATARGWQWIAAPMPYDLRDRDSLQQLLEAVRPDGIIHLAGQSFVPAALRDPAHTLNVNLIGTLNLLQALNRSQ